MDKILEGNFACFFCLNLIEENKISWSEKHFLK